MAYSPFCSYVIGKYYFKIKLEFTLSSLKFEREKFYPGPGIEPGPLALRASALPLRHPGQLLIQGRINLLSQFFLTSGLQIL